MPQNKKWSKEGKMYQNKTSPETLLSCAQSLAPAAAEYPGGVDSAALECCDDVLLAVLESPDGAPLAVHTSLPASQCQGLCSCYEADEHLQVEYDFLLPFNVSDVVEHPAVRCQLLFLQFLQLVKLLVQYALGQGFN